MNENRLTELQRKAVRAIRENRKVVVNACAGSGKTTTLIAAYMMKLEAIRTMHPDENPYGRMLAITFTNEAATKLRKEVFESSGYDIRSLTTSNISTIHSLCNSILHENAAEAGMTSDYQIVEENHIRNMMERALNTVVFGHISSDTELREFLTAYGLRDGSNSGGYGFREMVFEVYGWMRDHGLELGEGLAELDKGRDLFEQHLRTKFGDSDGLHSYISMQWRARDVISRYVSLFWHKIEQLKRQEGSIGYSDIVYYTYRLLRDSDAIRAEYRKRFYCVLVDEFQDTDFLQYSIINMISEKEKQFFVGDPQQSIYEWRSADPSILTTEENTAYAEDHETEIVSLNENFRSGTNIIRFINAFFSSFPVSGGSRYAEMIPSRKDSRGKNSGGDGLVTVLVPRGDGMDNIRREEAAMIAEEIAGLASSAVRPSLPGNAPADEVGRVSYSDISILFRSRKSMDLYEEALRERNIPYIHFHSRQFFEKPEIRIMMDLVRFVQRPRDPANLIAVLRSPVFDVDDDVLLRLSMNGFEPGSVFGEEELQKSPGLMYFREFHAILNSRENAGISELMHFAVDNCGYGLLVLSSAGGVQAYANVLKFMDMVLEAEREIPDRKGVIDFLLSLEEAGGSEEAPLNDDRSDAVRLMTVHASKGLEFPVVFIADSIRSNSSRFGDMLIHKMYGLVFRVRDDGFNPLHELSVDIMSDVNAAETERVASEERRILYVAMTRARDRLYISIPEGAARNGSWAALVLGFLKSRNFTIPAGHDAEVRQGDITLRVVRSPERRESIRETRGYNLAGMPILNESSLTLDIERLREQEWLRLTPSEVANFLTCPYRIALSAGKSGGSRDSKDSMKAKERGSMIHLFLEHYDYIKGTMPEYLKKVSGDLYGEALRVSMKFIDSRLGALAGKAAAEGRLRREVQFSSRYGRFILNGKIDMLAETDGRRLIIDYKSGNLEGGEAENRYQLMIYASAAAKIYGPCDIELFNFYLDREKEVENYAVTGEDIRTFDAFLAEALNSYASRNFVPRPSAANCLHCRVAESCTFRYGSTA